MAQQCEDLRVEFAQLQQQVEALPGSWCGSDETLYVPGWITIGIVGAVAGLYALYLAYRQRITHQGRPGKPGAVTL